MSPFVMAGSRFDPPRSVSRFLAITFAMVCLISLSGCWVTSLNSLYEDGKDSDVVVENRLVGAWSFTDDDQCVTTVTFALKDQGYSVRSIQEGEKCGEPGIAKLQEAKLVKLGEHEFLDVSPRSEDVCDACLAKHEIYMAKISEDGLELIPINWDWLNSAIESKTVELSTLKDDTDTLTASSKELKAFCREYANDEQVFSPEGLMLRKNE